MTSIVLDINDESKVDDVLKFLQDIDFLNVRPLSAIETRQGKKQILLNSPCKDLEICIDRATSAGRELNL